APGWRSRPSPLETRTASPGAPASADAAFAASAAASPPWPRRDPVPTMPGPIAHTATSNPRPAAQASAEPVVTLSKSPPKQLPAETVAVTKPRVRSTPTVSEGPRGSAPPAACTQPTPSPASAAHTGASWLCNEQHTTGMPSSVSGSGSSSSTWPTACWIGVYSSFITCAPPGGASPMPRVRFACKTSNPPEPSPSSRACTFTTTSSPSATGPVSPGYATHGTPSTSHRTRPSCRSTIALTAPRRRLRGMRYLDERQRDVHHPLEILDGDSLVRGVDVDHPVREVEALQAALVEDVRVGPAAAQPVAGLVAASLERGCRESHGLVVALEAIAAGALFDVRLHVALAKLRRERDGFQHLLDERAQLRLVVTARLGRK